MSNFTSIDSFKHVIKSVQRINKSNATFKVVEPVSFRGTVKLHGTNGGVKIDRNHNVTAHSRSRALTLKQDNAGFALFVAQREKAFQDLADKVLNNNACESVSFFGEFIGSGIQKGVAINKLPEKQFVIFTIRLNRADESNIYMPEDMLDSVVNDLSDQNIYRISEVPTYELTDVNFLDRDSMQLAFEKAEELTQEVEKQCPWGTLMGVEGIGEGIVWKPIGKYSGKTDLFFKTKGDKHKNVNETKTKVTIDLEVLESIKDFVDFAVTENRLQQGIEELKTAGHPIEAKSTGNFLKWISSDVYKECQQELVENGIEWKDTVKHVTEKARNFWLKTVNEI